MNQEELNKRAREIIEKIIYITIATSSKDAQPWNSPVYAVCDQNYNFYWASWTENQHSKNIRGNPNVFIVIYDSTVPEGTGEGVYIKAKAYELNKEEEIKRALSHSKNNPGEAKEYMGNYPRRIYKAIPEKVWVNVEGDVNGNYVDKRVEVKL